MKLVELPNSIQEVFMYKIAIGLFLILFVEIFPVQAQLGGWDWSNPQPQGFDLHAITPIPGTETIMVVGKNGTLLRSDDRGDNWMVEHRLNGFSGDFNAVDFPSATVGYIAGGSGYLFKSTDGGGSWEGIDTGINQDVITLDFATEGTGILSTGSSTLRTTNGGEDWEINLERGFSSIEFVNADTAYAGGWSNTGSSVFKTTNAGDSWTWLADFPGGPSLDISFPVADIGYAIFEAEPSLWKTTNGGSDWVQLPFEGSGMGWVLPQLIHFTDANTGFLVGWNGLVDGDGYFGAILKTTNGGETWIGENDYTLTNNIHDLTFVDATTGFTAGDRGDIMRTQNQGDDWQRLSTNTTGADLTSIQYVTSDVAYATGGHIVYGSWDWYPVTTVLKTTDAGLNWQNTGSYWGESVFHDLHFVTPDVGYVVGYIFTYHYPEGAVMIKTTDGGATWQSLYEDQGELHLRSVFFITADVGWVVGYERLNGTRSAILKTTDGGETWIPQDAGTTTKLNAVQFTDLDRGVIVGDDGMIFRTTNGGEDWQLVSSGVTADLHDVAFPISNSSQIGYAVGNSGTILMTADGGETWTPQESGTSDHLTSVQFLDVARGFAAGELTFLKTINGGRTWHIDPQTFPGSIRAVTFWNADQGLLAGDYGLILRTEMGGFTDVPVEQAAVTIPEHGALHQNYPNPFNPQTTIRFGLPEIGRVTLRIYDAGGKLIKTLVDGQLNAGWHQIRWDGKDETGQPVCSGLYLYQLDSNRLHQTRSMVLLR